MRSPVIKSGHFRAHMMKIIRTLAMSMLLVVPALAHGAELKAATPGNIEEFHYSWRLRGGLAWVAGLVFPRNGYGNLKTTFPKAGEHAISSELLITSPNESGFYAYETRMDESGERTLMTYHGYAWGNKSRKERTVFDYVKRLAHMHRETPTKVEDRIRPMPAGNLRDVLTAIFYLRQHAEAIKAPIRTTIFSDGKEYAVIFRPAGRTSFVIDGQRVNANGFEVVAAPGTDLKWRGGVTVWVSDDARRIPCRIEISETLASLQLDLQTVQSYAMLK
jgi:hypothetical protein